LIATKNLAIVGGSFDPIHNGHLHVIRKIIETKKFSRVIVIPAGNPWQKRPFASQSDRLTMTRLALEGIDADIEEYEINRAEPSYAIDTVLFLKEKYPETTFTWVIGSDALGNLNTWKEIDRLAKEVSFLVVTRPGHPIDPAMIYPGVNWNTIEISALDISATEIRKAIVEVRDVQQWIPEKVSAYIKEKGLYDAS
jgi:nicotinate-nucleotide adenylyltransferase